jgi:hypothetical protein
MQTCRNGANKNKQLSEYTRQKPWKTEITYCTQQLIVQATDINNAATCSMPAAMCCKIHKKEMHSIACRFPCILKSVY